MTEPIKPRALTYTEMMNGGRQQLDAAGQRRVLRPPRSGSAVQVAVVTRMPGTNDFGTRDVRDGWHGMTFAADGTASGGRGLVDGRLRFLDTWGGLGGFFSAALGTRFFWNSFLGTPSFFQASIVDRIRSSAKR